MSISAAAEPSLPPLKAAAGAATSLLKLPRRKRRSYASGAQAQLKAAEQKVIEHYDLYVRAMADLENARRRSSEELVKTRKFAIEKFAENLLPVVDSLEKALEATAADKDSAAREGMEATYRQLMHALDVSDMKPIDPKGEAFDPHFHMAITMVPAPEALSPAWWCRCFSAAGTLPAEYCVRQW